MATAPATEPLAELYTADETAWLDTTADQIRRRELAAVDFDHLAEFLTDMANRDRRQVLSRLVVLLAHLLKWEFQPAKRTRSWRASVIVQRQKLARLASSGVLRSHAEEVLAEAYEQAVERASAETGFPDSTFRSECPYTVDQLLVIDLPPVDAE